MKKSNQANNQLSDETLHAWVSALVDGEAELADSVRQTLDEDVLNEKWNTYHLIGDVMRTPDLALQPSSSFLQGLSARLEAEPTLLAPPTRRAWGLKEKWMSGLAVAAAVASVTWMAVPMLVEGEPTGVTASGVVVKAVTPAPTVDVALTDYLDAHQQLSGAAGGYRMHVSWNDEGARP